MLLLLELDLEELCLIRGLGVSNIVIMCDVKLVSSLTEIVIILYWTKILLNALFEEK